MDQNIIRIGNSTGIIIPKSLMQELKLREGSQVFIEKDETGEALIIAKKGAKRKASSLSPRFLKALDKVNNLYGQALRELAEK